MSDPDADEITRLSAEVLPGVFRKEVDSHKLLFGKVFGTQPAKLSIAPSEVEPLLIKCNGLLEEEITHQAEGYTSLEWLWFLRKFPKSAFSSQVPSVSTGVDQLAETATGRFSRQDEVPLVNPEVLGYEIHVTKIKRMLRLCVLSEFLCDIQTSVRFASLGVAFETEKNWLPKPIPTVAQKSSIELYRKRMKGPLSFFQGLGTTGGIAKADFDPDTCLFIVERHPNGGFAAHSLPLVDVIKLNSDERLVDGSWWRKELVIIVWYARFLTELMGKAWEAYGAEIEHSGYLLMTRVGFDELFKSRWRDVTEFTNRVFPKGTVPSDPDDMLNLLTEMKGELFPLTSGPPLRSDGSLLCLDCFTTRRLLEELTTFPKEDGEPANARAEHFELNVQSLIQFSPWRPSSEEMRSYRGRTLKQRGESITDVDALGEQSGVLLLVSCKSRIYDRMYDVGHAKAIRNAETVVEQAVKKWYSQLTRIRNAPKGDNFDFSKFSRIVGVVCTPFAVYVDVGEATAEVLPGLAAAVSAPELSRWLERPFTIPSNG